jgi:hypothetical protein
MKAVDLAASPRDSWRNIAISLVDLVVACIIRAIAPDEQGGANAWVLLRTC